MSYKIEKDIPIPVTNMQRIKKADHTPSIYESPNAKLLASMDIGDSFFVPANKVTDVLNKFYNPATRLGIRITARKVVDGVRIWRTY